MEDLVSLGLNFGIPTTIVGAILFSLFLAIQKGVWVPRQLFLDLKADRDYYRTAHENDRVVIAEYRENTKEVNTTLTLLVRLLQALPQAAEYTQERQQIIEELRRAQQNQIAPPNSAPEQGA